MTGFVWFLAFASIAADNGMTAFLCFAALIFHYLG
jgi:hypothetical protein